MKYLMMIMVAGAVHSETLAKIAEICKDFKSSQNQHMKILLHSNEILQTSRFLCPPPLGGSILVQC